jgi:hypothetical protein
VNVLLFSPVSSIWNHKTIEIALSRALKKLGHRVFELQCDGAMAPQCIAFSEAGIYPGAATNTDIERICGLCKSRAVTSLKLSKNLDGGTLGAFSISQSGLGGRSFHPEFPKSIGDWPKSLREASYETLVERKSSDLDLSREVQNHIKRAEINWYTAFERTTESIRKFDIDFLVLTDAHYSMNAGAWEAARQMGIRSATIGSALNFRNNGNAFSLFSSIEEQALITRSKAWDEVKNIPISKRDISDVNKNLKYLLSAKSAFTYSSGFRRISKKNVRKALGVSMTNPVVLVLTTTRDERFAAEVAGKMPRIPGPRNFDSQIDFLREIVVAAERLPAVSFVVRLHPRLLPNKRDNLSSDFANEIEEVLRNSPRNLKVNVPSQNLSLADVGFACDLALNWTSTAGLDLLALGVPVISCEPNETLSYPPEIGLQLGHRKGLIELLENTLGRAIEDGFAVMAFRYKTFLSKHLTVQIRRTATKRTKLSLFRILNWLRVRGGRHTGGFLFSLFDLIDGFRFIVRKNDLARIQFFFSSGASHLPIIQANNSPNRQAVEYRAVRHTLASFRRGRVFAGFLPY